VIHAPSDGRPGVSELVCNLSDEMTCVLPSVLQPLRNEMLSTCLAMFGSRSETHAPVSPYCFQVRGVAVNAPTPPSVAVLRFFENDSGSGWPWSLMSCGL
jgi:hypothetical protein